MAGSSAVTVWVDVFTYFKPLDGDWSPPSPTPTPTPSEVCTTPKPGDPQFCTTIPG